MSKDKVPCVAHLPTGSTGLYAKKDGSWPIDLWISVTRKDMRDI